ncbi:MAG: hypothetical protein LBF12_06370 [Christensenellaceae bacterium]|jgi:hypothetical protein|nr:hypothetical protein [Christensenellaceae bacterium]
MKIFLKLGINILFCILIVACLSNSIMPLVAVEKQANSETVFDPKTLNISSYEGFEFLKYFEYFPNGKSEFYEKALENLSTPKYVVVHKGKTKATKKIIEMTSLSLDLDKGQGGSIGITFGLTKTEKLSNSYSTELETGVSSFFTELVKSVQTEIKASLEYGKGEDVGVTYTFTDKSTSGSYKIYLSIDVTEYIIDIYDPKFDVEVVSVKEGKKTVIKEFNVIEGYSTEKNPLLSNRRCYFIDNETIPYYMLIKD